MCGEPFGRKFNGKRVERCLFIPGKSSVDPIKEEEIGDVM
jgi:hypothetical protein